MLHGGIQCSHIHYAWDQTKSVRQNLAEMGLAMDPNRAVPLIKRKVLTWKGLGPCPPHPAILSWVSEPDPIRYLSLANSASLY